MIESLSFNSKKMSNEKPSLYRLLKNGENLREDVRRRAEKRLVKDTESYPNTEERLRDGAPDIFDGVPCPELDKDE